MAKPKAKTRTKTRARPQAKPRAKAASAKVPRITLSSLRRPPGSHRARIRKGRGPGSGIGKTAGRGGVHGKWHSQTVKRLIERLSTGL